MDTMRVLLFLALIYASAMLGDAILSLQEVR